MGRHKETSNCQSSNCGINSASINEIFRYSFFLKYIFINNRLGCKGIHYTFVVSCRHRNKTDKQQNWMSYTEDIIFYVLWQWKYQWKSIDSINTDDVIALCPQCLRELNIETTSGYGSYETKFYMQCFHCDFQIKNLKGTIYDYKKLVIREIQGRIRSGEYKDKVKKTM
jgi:hypothetical protein